jgi:hypothetical protein
VVLDRVPTRTPAKLSRLDHRHEADAMRPSARGSTRTPSLSSEEAGHGELSVGLSPDFFSSSSILANPLFLRRWISTSAWSAGGAGALISQILLVVMVQDLRVGMIS